MTRHIVHMDLDTFFVSVERLVNSKLEGKPVIIGGMSDRGVVSSCSYEARQFGVHSAMPMKMARSLCSEAIVIRGTWMLTASTRGWSRTLSLKKLLCMRKLPSMSTTWISRAWIVFLDACSGPMNCGNVL